MKYNIKINNITRKAGNYMYSDVLPLNGARRDSISNLTSFGASNLGCRQTNAVSLRLAMGRHVNAA